MRSLSAHICSANGRTRSADARIRSAKAHTCSAEGDVHSTGARICFANASTYSAKGYILFADVRTQRSDAARRYRSSIAIPRTSVSLYCRANAQSRRANAAFSGANVAFSRTDAPRHCRADVAFPRAKTPGFRRANAAYFLKNRQKGSFTPPFCNSEVAKWVFTPFFLRINRFIEVLLRPLWWRGIGGFFPTGTHLLASLRAGLLQSTIAGNPLLGYFTPAYLRAIGSFSCRQSIIFSLIFPIIRGITPILISPKEIHLSTRPCH